MILSTIRRAVVNRFLRSQTVAVVAGTTAASLTPLAAVAQLHYSTGRVAFSLPLDHALTAALIEDDRVCCIVDRFPDYNGSQH